MGFFVRLSAKFLGCTICNGNTAWSMLKFSVQEFYKGTLVNVPSSNLSILIKTEFREVYEPLKVGEEYSLEADAKVDLSKDSKYPPRVGFTPIKIFTPGKPALNGQPPVPPQQVIDPALIPKTIYG